jgi:alpha-mannosidase
LGVAEPEWYRNLPSPLPAQASLVEVAPPNVVLSSMRLIKSGSEKEKPEYELRLYETAGQATDAVVKLGCAVDSVRQTNFLGEPLDAAGKIKTNGREIVFRIQPWKIVTLRIGSTR